MSGKRNIADRGRRFIRGIGVGGLCGAVIAAALWLWLMAPDGGRKLTKRDLDTYYGVAFLAGAMGAMVGGTVGAFLTRALTTSAVGRRRMARPVLWGVLVAAVLWGPLAYGVIADFGAKGLPLTSALGLAGAFLVAFVGIGAFFGLLMGDEAAAEGEKQGRQGMRRADGPTSREVMRHALEQAWIEKFGSLDDARREKIRTWDEGRLAEARRKLPEAKRAEELD